MKSAKRPIVTVGLCVRNAEATIAEAVDGILGQDYPHELMEIVVVDGHSRDRTLSIIRDGLSRIEFKVKFLSENVGLGYARQLVVDNAIGDYIVWVDFDIILSKEYIKKQVAFMEKHPNVGTAVGSFGILPSDNWVAALENIGYVLDSLRHRNEPTSKLIGTEGAIFRVEAVRRAGGFSKDIRGAQEDIDLALRMRKNGWKSFITDAVLYEKQRSTWKAIWKQHCWYGYGLHLIQHKNKGRNLISDKSVDRIILSSEAYRLTHRKVVFLLPVNFIFKKVALFAGFLSAHFDGYGHFSKN